MTSTTQDALDAIDRAVFNSPEPMVVALTGGWGEGKTWFWKNRVIAKDRMPPQAKSPGYVSVFGADSMTVIRERVALAGLRSNKLAEKVPAAVTNKLAPLLSALKNAVGEKIGLSDSLAVELLQDQGLEEGWTVCIDDAERLSSDVRFDKFLGYVSELRDKWRIKVVLIYNSEALARGGDDSAFNQYREKVIDREIPFVPDQADVVKVAFGTMVLPDFDVVGFVTAKSAALGLRNIRVLIKARAYLQDVIRVLGQPLPNQFLHVTTSALLLSCFVKFCYAKPPGLTFSRLANNSISIDRLRNSPGIDEETNNSAPEDALLDKFGYLYTDDLTRMLMSFVQTDTLDEARLREQYEGFNETIKKIELDARLRKVWDVYYHGTLRDNSDELCDAVTAAMEPYLQYVPFNNLDYALDLLCRLGRCGDADRLFAKFKELRGHELPDFADDLPSINAFKFAPLAELAQTSDRALGIDSRSLIEVMEAAFDERHLSSRDASRLAHFTADDFITYLTTHDKPRLTSQMRLMLQGPNAELRTIIRNAAVKIATSSPLNRMRMEGMGLLGQQDEH